MLFFEPALLEEVRNRFAHVTSCPFTGERIFMENAGGALTLKSVANTSAQFAAIPDNQGRNNEASKQLVNIINKAMDDVKCFFNASSGQVFVGESGTELLFRLIRNACLGAKKGGNVVSSTFEHPATRSAAARWAEITERPHLLATHDDATGTIDAAAYEAVVTTETRVVTILHTSPVTGMGTDLPAIVAAVRNISPQCVIIIDGIQHAAHGNIDIDAMAIDGYVISPYKVFSRHGFGMAWISDRLTGFSHDTLIGAPAERWELGTRDTGSYATMTDVVDYFTWLGSKFSSSENRRTLIEAASKAIHDHEHALTDAMINGIGNHKGLASMPSISIIGGIDNPSREGLVSVFSDEISSADLVAALDKKGIRVHIRKADFYSRNILDPLGLEDCVRISLCHYNSPDEIAALLIAMEEILNCRT